MSIISDALTRKITWTTAAQEIGQWFSQVFAHAAPEAQQALTAAQAELKQAASNAIAFADTALGPIIAAGAATVSTAANTALAAALGPVGAGAITPAMDAAIIHVAESLKAEIDAEAIALRAKLSGAAAH